MAKVFQNNKAESNPAIPLWFYLIIFTIFFLIIFAISRGSLTRVLGLK